MISASPIAIFSSIVTSIFSSSMVSSIFSSFMGSLIISAIPSCTHLLAVTSLTQIGSGLVTRTTVISPLIHCNSTSALVNGMTGIIPIDRIIGINARNRLIFSIVFPCTFKVKSVQICGNINFSQFFYFKFKCISY